MGKNKKIRKVLSIVIAICVSIVAFSATIPPYDNITPPFRKPQTDITHSMNAEFDSLSKIFGKNKIIPKRFEKQIIYALSFFPELININIEFKVVNGDDGIISTRPVISSVFKKSSNRSYIVFIQDSSINRKLPSFVNGPVNGQVGILGHELCHIIYFNNRSGFGLIGLGVNHISTRYMDNFENKTDSMDIELGLGYQLIDWGEYLRERFQKMTNNTGPRPLFEAPGRERYMSTASIKRVMAKSKIYQ